MKRTPLHGEHLKHGAKMVEFAGYDMPVQYSSVIAECKAVREVCGLFDVSHMARLRFTGEGAEAYLDRLTLNDVTRLEDGGGQYSMLTNEQGGVVDDIIVYRMAQGDFGLVVNAANHAKDVEHLNAHLPADVEMADDTAATAMIAVQGPKAEGIVAGLAADGEAIRGLGLFQHAELEIAGEKCFAARSGYTGEDGFEVVCSAEHGPALWQALVEAGGVPCGLGSRDALRVEAGLPLYGHELTDDLSPITAGLGWVMPESKGDFLGGNRIKREKEEGTSHRSVGILMDGRRRPEIGSPVLLEGEQIGEVTSGVYSPLMERGLGFALIRKGPKLKTPCEVEIRGKREPATLVGRRFYKRG